MKTKFKSIDELPLSLSAGDIAATLGISRAGAYTLIKSEGFPCIQIGGRYVVPKSKFLQWMDENSKGGSEPWKM